MQILTFFNLVLPPLPMKPCSQRQIAPLLFLIEPCTGSHTAP